MKTYMEMKVQLRSFLTSALHVSEWSASRPGFFTPEERAPGTYWVGLRTSVDSVEKRKKFLPPTGIEVPSI
jgi:hypothetical protein